MTPRRRLAVIALLLAAAAGAVLGFRWLHASGQRDEGLKLAKAGKFVEAEPLLQDALTRDGNDLEVIAALAQLKLKGTDPAAAEEFLTRWCDLAPRDERPFQLRMDLRHRIAKGKWATADRVRVLELAAADGRRVLELNPGNDEVRREVVGLLLDTGRFAEAEQDCRRCLQKLPTDAQLLYLLAKACHAQGAAAAAAAALEPVLRDRPRFPEAMLLRAVLFREADQPDRAVHLLRQALALDNCPRKDCLYQLGLALAAAGEDAEARRVMAELDLLTLQDAVARDQFPDTPAMQVQIAEAMLNAGRADEARAKLEAVLAADPTFAPARRVLRDMEMGRRGDKETGRRGDEERE